LAWASMLARYTYVRGFGVDRAPFEQGGPGCQIG